MGALDASFIKALRDYLLSLTPPSSIDHTSWTTDNVIVGKYQDSPLRFRPVISIHVGNQLDSGTAGKREWMHEVDDDVEPSSFNCNERWWKYRYTLRMRWFGNSTENRDEVYSESLAMAHWLTQQINGCDTNDLLAFGLDSPSSYGEKAITHAVKGMDVTEGGGSGSYITDVVLLIEQRVVVS